MRMPWLWSLKLVSFGPHCKIASTLTIRSQHFVPIAVTGAKAYLILECNQAKCRNVIYIETIIAPSGLALSPNDPFYMYPTGAILPPHPAIPKPIAEDWEEAQRTMQAAAPKAAAVMFRRVLYSILIDKGCKLKPLKEGLEQLIQGQRLPAIFDEWLPAIRDDGHDGAHPDRALQVSAENIAETFEYTSELLRFLYIEP
jgi:hypothetical protein